MSDHATDLNDPLDKAQRRGDHWKRMAVLMEADRDRVATALDRAEQRATALDAVLARVHDLAEQWAAAGPPPLGVSVGRWWDRRLAELRAATTATPQPAAGLLAGTRQCGHDDYHDGHQWPDQPHMWCPGHNYADDDTEEQR